MIRKTPLKRGGPIKRKPPTKEQTDKKKEEAGKMWEFFLSVWESRPHKSYVSEKTLGNEPKSYYFHHILPSRKYPEAKYDKANIVLLTLDEHSRVEFNPIVYEKVNKIRERLLLKYEKSTE